MVYDLSFFRYEIKRTVLDYPAYIYLRKDGRDVQVRSATCSEISTSTSPPTVNVRCTASDTSTDTYEANEIYLNVLVDAFTGAVYDIALIKTALVTKAPDDRLDIEVNIELKQAS